jgi:hypothetical protein
MLYIAGTHGVTFYLMALAEGSTTEEALEIGQRVYTADLEKIETSGLFSDTEIAALNRGFDPENPERFVTGTVLRVIGGAAQAVNEAKQVFH